MVDFQDPAVIEKDILKLYHVVDGIFIWEFFVTLDYELSVVKGHRPYRWTIWIYSLTRVCTLIAVILNLVALDSSGPINCQLWIVFESIFAYFALAAASALIVLRVIAIWNRNKIAMAIAICAWCTNVAFLIHGVTQLYARWVPAQSYCEIQDTEKSNKNTIATLVSDVVLLLTMLAGLLRLRRDGTMLGMGQLLWKQGLVWLFVATIAEVPPAVFISLNLNYPLNLMFQIPALIVLTIAATRMHRSLTDFTHSGFVGTYPTRRGHMANTDPKLNFAGPISLDQVEVVVHTSSEDYSPVNMKQYASFGLDSADNQSQDKSLVLSVRDDLESCVKKDEPPPPVAEGPH
ncbi:hypothetical protein V8E53_000270 [Lactarius tabidus]